MTGGMDWGVRRGLRIGVNGKIRDWFWWLWGWGQKGCG